VRRGSQGDLGFRLGTGAFAVLVVAIVVGIGAVLISESWLSIQKFGLGFWQTSTWDPVAGDFGALPFIWGTLYSSILALVIATPVALGIAIFIAELCPAWLRMPPAPALLPAFSPPRVVRNSIRSSFMPNRLPAFATWRR